MDRNTILGILLLFGLFYVYVVINAPTEEEIAAQRAQDSIAALEQNIETQMEADASSSPLPSSDGVDKSENGTLTTDSLRQPETVIEEKIVTLENDLIEIQFTTKGAQFKGAWLKEYERVVKNGEGKEVKEPLYLMNNPDNTFEYIIPKTSGGYIISSDLGFRIQSQDDRQVTLVADLPQGGNMTQVFNLTGDYTMDHEVSFQGLDAYLQPQDQISLNWINHLNKLERSSMYERTYSTVHFKTTDDSPDYCSWTGDDEEIVDRPLRWVSHSNQFFNSSIIAKDGFHSGILETKVPGEESEDLKILRTNLALTIDNPRSETLAFELYIGPNDFERLQELGYEMQDIIPYGWSIFGTINRWVIRPVFEALSGFIGNLGIAIVILTFFIKFALYPLTYRMLHSQAKMAALKPEISKIKDKTKGDNNAQQMETMKLYREYGVNPLGGCMPMVLQMPIWFALYRFFPASINFRQEGFLWADDLSSYDVFFQLPFYIPAYGDHVSLFTLLWAVSLFAYTWYNMKNMDNSMMQGNPMMKYMQYLMPVMFLFFLNSYASGLTCYLLFSNLFNITQTVVTKNFVFNEERIKEELNKNKDKPKKKSGFQARLQQVMEEQRKQQERNKKK
jgi:YidC/Oxa1 family membrane protein insertase